MERRFDAGALCVRRRYGSAPSILYFSVFSVFSVVNPTP